jgi:phosphatidylserine decarboxylase
MLTDKLFITLQYILPQKALSRLCGTLANIRVQWLKNFLIRKFIQHYNVNLEQAQHTNYRNYPSFNAFFTRHLQPGARKIASNTQLVSPVDGTISQIGDISTGDIFQAKGHQFSVASLLAGSEHAASFNGGSFSTIYLAPHDYHRIHATTNGQLISMSYIPGKLFSVNPTTTAHVPGLFARNERVVCILETDMGKVAIVMVGALIVGSIVTNWSGIAAEKYNFQYHSQNYNNISVTQGDDIAHFQLGSTVVLLTEQKIQWQTGLAANSSLSMGQALL